MWKQGRRTLLPNKEMNSGAFRNVVVDGGATGRLTANVLRKSASCRKLDCKIYLEESSRILTTGAGKGGIDEFKFLRQADATIEWGICRRSWRHPGLGYRGPIDDPLQLLVGEKFRSSSAVSRYCFVPGQFTKRISSLK